MTPGYSDSSESKKICKLQLYNVKNSFVTREAACSDDVSVL